MHFLTFTDNDIANFLGTNIDVRFAVVQHEILDYVWLSLSASLLT